MSATLTGNTARGAIRGRGIIKSLIINKMKKEIKKTFDGVSEKRKFIEEYLEKIDWSLRHHGCDHWYFYNHKKKNTGMYLLFPETDGRICVDGEDYSTPSIVFYLKDITIELLDNDCVSFCGRNDKSIFILCPNYDKTKKIKKPNRKINLLKSKK